MFVLICFILSLSVAGCTSHTFTEADALYMPTYSLMLLRTAHMLVTSLAWSTSESPSICFLFEWTHTLDFCVCVFLDVLCRQRGRQRMRVCVCVCVGRRHACWTEKNGKAVYGDLLVVLVLTTLPWASPLSSVFLCAHLHRCVHVCSVVFCLFLLYCLPVYLLCVVAAFSSFSLLLFFVLLWCGVGAVCNACT